MGYVSQRVLLALLASRGAAVRRPPSRRSCSELLHLLLQRGDLLAAVRGILCVHCDLVVGFQRVAACELAQGVAAPCRPPSRRLEKVSAVIPGIGAILLGWFQGPYSASGSSTSPGPSSASGSSTSSSRRAMADCRHARRRGGWAYGISLPGRPGRSPSPAPAGSAAVTARKRAFFEALPSVSAAG